MAERLKNLFFTDEFIHQLGMAIKEHYPAFDPDWFAQMVCDDDWDKRDLKDRMRHISHCLHETLPDDYPRSLAVLLEVAPRFSGFDAMVFPDFVECYGLGEWDLSLPALVAFTKIASSEFAIRPFIASNPDRAMAAMVSWARDTDPRVRRLSSEGCRPRLPWAMALPAFKQDPGPILPILEALKDDESESVRKSVANNLNDISKDHPELVLDICEGWRGHTKNTDWIVKHACRTLLKAGNRRAMLLFGFGDPEHIQVENLVFDRDRLQIGETLTFDFDLVVAGEEPCKTRLEYVVHYAKTSGKTSRKVFQLKESTFDPGRHRIASRQSFADQSTRKHHPGEHSLSIIVNGVEKKSRSLKLESARALNRR